MQTVNSMHQVGKNYSNSTQTVSVNNQDNQHLQIKVYTPWSNKSITFKAIDLKC